MQLDNILERKESMNTLNDLEQMKTINIFFYEDKNQTNECKRLESFKKFLLSAEPCSGSE